MPLARFYKPRKLPFYGESPVVSPISQDYWGKCQQPPSEVRQKCLKGASREG